jgi:hypothetical protein
MLIVRIVTTHSEVLFHEPSNACLSVIRLFIYRTTVLFSQHYNLELE